MTSWTVKFSRHCLIETHVSPQDTQLDASGSLDEDGVDDVSFAFSWYCDNGSGGACLSPTGENLLETYTSTNEAVLHVPAGSLPIGKSRGITKRGKPREYLSENSGIDRSKSCPMRS